MKIDAREWYAAQRWAIEHGVKRESHKWLNKSALQVIIGSKGVKGATQRTPRATKSRIRRDLKKDKLLIKLAVKRLKKKGEPITRQSIRETAKRILNSRLSAIAYTASVGWHNAAISFGGRGFNPDRRFKKSRARKGKGKKATAHRLVAEMTNTAPAAAKIGFAPLQASINAQAVDLKRYAEKRLAEKLAKVSARR